MQSCGRRSRQDGLKTQRAEHRFLQYSSNGISVRSDSLGGRLERVRGKSASFPAWIGGPASKGSPEA